MEQAIQDEGQKYDDYEKHLREAKSNEQRCKDKTNKLNEELQTMMFQQKTHAQVENLRTQVRKRNDQIEDKWQTLSGGLEKALGAPADKEHAAGLSAQVLATKTKTLEGLRQEVSQNEADQQHLQRTTTTIQKSVDEKSEHLQKCQKKVKKAMTTVQAGNQSFNEVRTRPSGTASTSMLHGVNFSFFCAAYGWRSTLSLVDGCMLIDSIFLAGLQRIRGQTWERKGTAWTSCS